MFASICYVLLANACFLLAVVVQWFTKDERRGAGERHVGSSSFVFDLAEGDEQAGRHYAWFMEDAGMRRFMLFLIGSCVAVVWYLGGWTLTPVTSGTSAATAPQPAASVFSAQVAAQQFSYANPQSNPLQEGAGTNLDTTSLPSLPAALLPPADNTNA